MSKKLKNQFLCSRMMLPEHKERLREYHKKMYGGKTELPLFDEQQLEEFQCLLIQSLQCGLEVELTILTETGQKIITGVVRKADALSAQLTVVTKDGIVTVSIRELAALKEI